MIGTSVHPRMRSADLEPVDVGQPEVEDDDVGRGRRGHGQALAPGRRGGDVVAPGLEAEAQGAQQARVVVDDQDARHYGSPASKRGDGQLDDEPGAAARRVLVPDARPVGLDERARDGQPEARAAAGVESA